jgi:hypothetical protein
MAKSKGRKTHHPSIGALVESLVSESRSPARLLELYYWSTEPELLPIIRGFAALPSGTRVQLEAFLHATDPETVSAAIETDGDIRLTRNGARRFAKAPPSRPRHA